MKWLFFSYTLPAEPSKSRVYIWRQLRKLGAVNYQSVWVVPYSAERLSELKKLMEDIGDAGVLIGGKVLSKSQEEGLSKAFMESRNEEYREIIHKCDEFVLELEDEIAKENFIFAEVEENEEELDKLKQWFKKVEKRDVLKSPMQKEALEKIRMCDKIFESFASRVYDSQLKTKSKEKPSS